jgi:predicted PurR-regulated permease PerM
MTKQTVKVEISITSVLTVVGTLVGLWILFYLREIVLLVFVAFIIASALGPVLRTLQRHRIPQVVSIASTFLIIIGLVTLLGFMIIPALFIQMSNFLHHLPDIIGRAAQVITGSSLDQAQFQSYSSQTINALTGGVQSISSNVVQVGLGIFSGFISAVTVIVMSFYFILERDQLYKGLELLMPHNDFIRVRNVTQKVEHKLGSWLRGQLLLGVIIGVASWAGLMGLGLHQYALPLAIIAGILELVPIIGPIVSAIPAVVIALTISPALAVAVVILYLVIQQLESHLIVPKVMEKAVGLNPLFVIIALLAGGALMGIMGALLAVPAAVVIATILEDIREYEGKSLQTSRQANNQT